MGWLLLLIIWTLMWIGNYFALGAAHQTMENFAHLHDSDMQVKFERAKRVRENYWNYPTMFFFAPVMTIVLLFYSLAYILFAR